MKNLYGDDIGTSVDFRSDVGVHQVQHPWPEETVVSAGRGIVFRRGSRETYQTLFMEVYPPGASFIRGEGATPAECEDAAWRKYQLALRCDDDHDEHEWESRGYRNGAGFCRHCGTFRSDVFTAEQLGQFCHVCGEATAWSWEDDGDGDVRFLCRTHEPAHRTNRPGGLLQALLEELSAAADDTDNED